MLLHLCETSCYFLSLLTGRRVDIKTSYMCSRGTVNRKMIIKISEVSFKHDKDGIKIFINIYNTNNLANEGGNAGVEQTASEGSQNLTGKDGENASQGGQIADKGGQNANQFGQVVRDGGENTIEDADNEPG
jgi:hypothetical protein